MITVLTTGRSASTWYCKELAKQLGYQNLGEVFLTEHSGYKFLINPANFNKENKTIVKLLAYQQLRTMKTHKNAFNKVIKNSSKVIFLIRRDFYLQIKSSFSGLYLKDKFKMNLFDQFDEPIIIIPKDYIDMYWHLRVEIAEQELLYLLDLYNSIEQKELVFTEDITTDSSRLKRPFLYETDLEFPHHLQTIIEQFK